MTMVQRPGQSQGVAPFIDALQKIQDHFASLKRKNLTASDVMPLLVEGWDCTRNLLKVDEPGDGMWRAPHLAIVNNIEPIPATTFLIISPGMSVAQLQAGLWRQLRIFPTNEAWRRSAVDQAAHADPFAPEAPNYDDHDPAIDEQTQLARKIAKVDVGDSSREEFFVSLIGHTVTDASEFILQLEKSHPELARMLLAKDFKAAMASYPELLALPWPRSCISRFNREKRHDHLPPVLTLVLLAGLALHAQVQAPHNRISFDKSGRRIDLKTVREDIATVAGGNALTATKLVLRFKWLQSSALLPPAAIMGSADQETALAWTEESQCAIAKFSHDAGNAGINTIDSALRAVMSPKPGAELEWAVRDFVSQPNVWSINRAKGSPSFPNRLAITFHGMTWSESASVALTLIADQARTWSEQFRPNSSIPKRRTDGRPSLAQSIAATMYCWLETSAPTALYGTYLDNARRNGVDVREPSAISSEDLVINAEAGKDLLRNARRIIELLPSAGMRGFSALAHASLWFEDQHDDLDHYRAMARASLRSIIELNALSAARERHDKIPPGVVASASFRGRGKAGLPGRQGKKAVASPYSKKAKQGYCKQAALVAQAEAMLLGPTATDSMRAYLLSIERKK